MKKRIAILGSTGSIGQQTLQVIDSMSDKYSVVSLTAHKNEKLLSKQAEKYSAEYIGLSSKDPSCLKKALEIKNIDMCVVATKGIQSLEAIFYALEKNIDIAIANKESIVCAGELIQEKKAKSKSKFLPLDSEHSAIWQCLGSKRANELILTASGGYFYDTPIDEMDGITHKRAEEHPVWKMGKDVTLDSNTMFNKTMEVLEAKWLFDMPTDKIKMVVHRQGVAHSFVRFSDGTLIGQFAGADMRLPIKYALSYPQRTPNDYTQLDLCQMSGLTFSQVDVEKFPCSQLCYLPVCNTRNMSTVMVAANDACRILFRNGKILFTEFYPIIKNTCEKLFDLFASSPLTLVNIIGCYDYAYKYVTNNYRSVK